MIIQYDETGRIIPAGDLGWSGKRFNLEVDTVPEGDFPISYIGDIYFDELHKCVVDDREIKFWYEVIDNQIVKIGWPERFTRGEFTLEQFREKVINLLKRNYHQEASKTDADFLMYSKRITTNLLEPGDKDKYDAVLYQYTKLTTKYRQDREAVTVSKSIDELSKYFR